VDRRRFVVTAVGAGLASAAGSAVATANAATEDDLAFANFGASTEFLVQDYYTKALDARLVSGPKANVLRRGKASAVQHAKALSDLIGGAGDSPPLADDFEFEWPASTFKSEKDAVTTGVGVLRALLGAYQTAAATVTEQSHRVLYASLTASVGQQLVALAVFDGANAVEPFPIAIDLETASDALERYLG
jgi:ferritin-like protein